MKHIHLLPWLIIGALCAAAFFLRFVLWGYSFSALVCCCLAAIIAFYEVSGMLLPHFPAAIPLIRRVFTICLAVGIAVVAVTEGIIIKASFGSPAQSVDYLVVLGYSKAETFFRIILPQVVKRILPAVTNEVITLVKDTSLAFVIGYAELFTLVKRIAAKEASVLPFVGAAIFYYVFNLVVAVIMEKLEKKMSYYN